MAKKETAADRFKRFALWQWGLLMITAAIVAQAVMTAMSPPIRGQLTMEQRAQALGRGIAVLLFVIAGVVLIIIHFVRRKK